MAAEEKPSRRSRIGPRRFQALGPGYASAGVAMVLTIVAMAVFDVVHPPSIATALSFGLKAGDADNLALIGLQKLSMWMIGRWTR